MTASPTNVTTPAAAARRLTTGVVILAAAFARLSVLLTPDSLRMTALRFVVIGLVGVFVGRGSRAARLLLVVLTGLAALYSAVLAFSRPMPPGWRIVFLGYGVGTLWCLSGLFRRPASEHFVARSDGSKGSA